MIESDSEESTPYERPGRMKVLETWCAYPEVMFHLSRILVFLDNEYYGCCLVRTVLSSLTISIFHAH